MKKHRTSTNAPFQSDATEVSNQMECQSERVRMKKRKKKKSDGKRALALNLGERKGAKLKCEKERESDSEKSMLTQHILNICDIFFIELNIYVNMAHSAIIYG